MKLVRHIEIPVDISFEDLQLSRDPVTGVVAFDLEPVEKVCEANHIDADVFLTEENIGALLSAWYQAHLASGGAPDPVQEQLMAEVEAEDEFGLINVQEGAGDAAVKTSISLINTSKALNPSQRGTYTDRIEKTC